MYLVYEGENHNVARPESQADYLHRQLEWFGYYLKGDPPASWITDGETYLARQRILKDGTTAPGQVRASWEPDRARRQALRTGTGRWTGGSGNLTWGLRPLRVAAPVPARPLL